MSTKVKDQLQARKRRLVEQLKPLRELEEELREVEMLLSSYERHGAESVGHQPGCRCHECDPSR